MDKAFEMECSPSDKCFDKFHQIMLAKGHLEKKDLLSSK